MKTAIQILAALALAWPAFAAEPPEPPAISHVFPAGGQLGTRFSIELHGKWSGWPVQGWTAASGVRLTPEAEAGRFRVEIAPSAPPGPTLLRFFNDAGATAPLQFVIGDATELVESADLEASGAGVPVRAFPVAINGRLLEPDRPDLWLLPLAQPTRLTAQLQARALDSPLRARLELVGEQDRVISEATTTPATEPTLSTAIAAPGLYVLRVFAAAGSPASSFGPAAIYRLRLTTEPLADASRDGASERPPLSPDIQRPLLTANVLAPPESRVAFISPPGQVDVFGVEARAGRRYAVSVASGAAGERFEARLEIFNPESAMIATADGEDVELEFLANRAGLYELRVSDSGGGGGPTHGYTLAVTSGGLEFVGELAADRVVLRPGGATKVRLKVTRPPDFTGVLVASVSGLPPGVTAAGALLPPGLDTVELTLQAAGDAVPANQPFRVNLLPISGALPREVVARAVLAGRNSASAMLLINGTEAVWLTVAGEPSLQ